MKKFIILFGLFLLTTNLALSNENECDGLKKFSGEFLKCSAKKIKKGTVNKAQNFKKGAANKTEKIKQDVKKLTKKLTKKLKRKNDT